eukprot:263112-Hanusia_phi.AAC.3
MIPSIGRMAKSGASSPRSPFAEELRGDEGRDRARAVEAMRLSREEGGEDGGGGEKDGRRV